MTRLHITFVVLVVVAAGSLGMLTSALAWQASPVTGLTVAALGLVLVTALGLVLRLLFVADRSSQ
ncbi:MAG: hypothetical protein ACC652_12115 [Acidimicrobiales bacterium]